MSEVELPTKFTRIEQPDQLTVVEVGQCPLNNFFFFFYVINDDFAHIIYLTLLCFKGFFLERNR